MDNIVSACFIVVVKFYGVLRPVVLPGLLHSHNNRGVCMVADIKQKKGK